MRGRKVFFFLVQELVQGCVRMLCQEATQLANPDTRAAALLGKVCVGANICQPTLHSQDGGCARPAAHLLHAKHSWQGPAFPTDGVAWLS